MMPAAACGLSRWVLRAGDGICLVREQGGGWNFPLMANFEIAGNPLVDDVGGWQGAPCRAADIGRDGVLPGGQVVPLRDVFAVLGEEAFVLAGRAVQWLDWLREHRYCGACGHPTRRAETARAMWCEPCDLYYFPRISPAAMVLVQDGRRLLLARSPRFKPEVYSALAGFVEPGETIEECAIREVREEVGLEIANLRYVASQSWPFPHSLMVAFLADYAGGEIVADRSEIEAVGWFSPDALPVLPERLSIARRLIELACRGAAEEAPRRAITCPAT